MAEEDETVRVILGAGKSSIKHAYSLLKKHYDSKGKVPNFTDSELLNESLSNSNVAIKALHREYKRMALIFYHVNCQTARQSYYFMLKTEI